MSQCVQIEKENSVLQENGIEFFTIQSKLAGECTASAHIHNAIELLYITEGVFHFYIGKDRYIAQPGDLVLLFANTVHSIFLDSSAGAYYVLKLKPSVFLEILPGNKQGLIYLLPFTAGQTYLFPKDLVCDLGIDKTFHEMHNHRDVPQFASLLFIKANALRICAVLLNQMHQQHALIPENISHTSLQRIYETMRFISDHYASDITAKSCAWRAEMSYAHFSRTFKQVCGYSFSAYLTQIRLQNAVQQLILTEKTVTEICFDCGFNDVSYFIAQFKTFHGIAPAQFRNQNKKYTTPQE